MPSSPIRFAAPQGHELAARLDLPEGEPRAFALFAHCFTCSKDSKAAAYISQALATRGIAVLRASLLLLNGVVYTAWSSHCDFRPYTGWIIGYDEKTLAQTSVLNVTPNGNEGSFWGAGAGPAADSTGNIIALQANGYGGVCKAAPTDAPLSETVSNKVSSRNFFAASRVSSIVCTTGSRRYSGSEIARNSSTES